jgi:hypothetical protein
MSIAKKYPTRSAEIRARVGHPIIDSDGHVVEFEPALMDYIRDTGGSKVLERYKTAWDTAFYFRWNHITPEERREFRVPRPVWWPYPAKNTYTARLPRCPSCFMRGLTRWVSASPWSIRGFVRHPYR